MPNVTSHLSIDIEHHILKTQMKSARECSSCHPCVAIAAADGRVDSHALGTVLPLNPYGVVLQHAGANTSSHQHAQQGTFQHKQRHAKCEDKKKGANCELVILKIQIKIIIIIVIAV